MVSKRGLLILSGLLWSIAGFNVLRKGKVVKRFAPVVKPEQIAGEIEALL